MCGGECKKSAGKPCGGCSKSMAHAFKKMKGKSKGKPTPAAMKLNPFAGIAGKKGA